MIQRFNLRRLRSLFTGVVLFAYCIGFSGVSESAGKSQISTGVNIEVNAVDLAELISDWAREIWNYWQAQESNEIKNQIPIFITKLGFSQDCAWEKRFSCGEQPRTKLSQWRAALTPGDAYW
jgi:hypothetical protein